MENLCHTLAGAVLARAGLDRTTPLATATLLVASNMPDIDVVSLWWGDLAYLEHHRGVTHSLAGLLIEAPVLAGAVLAFDRLVRRPRKPDAPPARFGRLAVVALAGLFVHLLLDWTNNYGVRPLVPFDSAWWYGDLVFIVDPWMWLLLGGALFVGARRKWTANIGWGLVFAAMSAAVAFSLAMPSQESGGPGAVAIWFALLSAVLTIRARWREIPALGAARLAIVAVVSYWCVLGIANAAALKAVQAGQEEPAALTVASPTLMRPDRWRVFSVRESEVRSSQVYLGRESIPLTAYRRNLDDPRVRAALRTCPGSVALAFNRLLYAEPRIAQDGTEEVALRDARFSRVPGGSDFATTVVALDPAGAPATDDRPCRRGIWPW